MFYEEGYEYMSTRELIEVIRKKDAEIWKLMNAKQEELKGNEGLEHQVGTLEQQLIEEQKKNA